MNSKLTLYEKLELLPPNSLRPTAKALWARRLSHVMRQLLRSLALTNEPRITQAGVSQTGEPLFNGYDPVTCQRIRGVSETELRIWLEQHHRQTQGVSKTDLHLWLGLHHW